ncbi:hypothetical protein CB1_000075014 [Camelus ferus]|nr:hypothetical protein CB1_000075014 [Camelus ferus]
MTETATVQGTVRAGTVIALRPLTSDGLLSGAWGAMPGRTKRHQSSTCNRASVWSVSWDCAVDDMAVKMALNGQLSLQGLCFLHLSIMVGGQGKCVPPFLDQQQRVDTLVKGGVPGAVVLKSQCRPCVLDQEGTTLTVNIGSSPVEGRLVVAAGFT